MLILLYYAVLGARSIYTNPFHMYLFSRLVYNDNLVYMRYYSEAVKLQFFSHEFMG